jgi:hypothetical protein
MDRFFSLRMHRCPVFFSLVFLGTVTSAAATLVVIGGRQVDEGRDTTPGIE